MRWGNYLATRVAKSDAPALCVMVVLRDELRDEFPADMRQPAHRGDGPHVTLLYQEGLDRGGAGLALAAIFRATGWASPFSMPFGDDGVQHFDNDDQSVAYAPVSSPGLMALRARIEEELGGVGIVPQTHDGGYTPHATIAYLDAGERWGGRCPCGVELVERIEVYYGRDVPGVVIPLTGRESIEKADLSLPQYMIDALKRGLRLHEEGKSGEGLRAETVAAATRGVRDGRWSEDKWIRASAWFARHRSDWKAGVDDQPGQESPGFVAWLLWGDGGDERGRERADRTAADIKAERAKVAKSLKVRLLKKAEEVGDEQFVLGVVLVPEEYDRQDDIYSAEEIRRAAHNFVIGLITSDHYLGQQHNGPFKMGVDVVMVESYLAAVDMQIPVVRDGVETGEVEVVPKGTWMMGWKILDDDLWARFKRGDFTGFSIGGWATEIPVEGAA
ncbi:MAG: 2'-5' RNA ligase family protein [Gammaproteobacteria bacterium]|nr:2'-5' RNA ligase family protein [Gammaproteobacteria bacterium]